MNPIVILGSGLAGYTVIRELRKLNRDIPITLVSRDSGDYYSKPMLSNAFAQHKDATHLVLTSADEMAKQLDIELLTHTEVSAIHRADKQLETSAGTLHYDKLVLALGADPIRISLLGDAANEVMSVNDLADYAKLREALNGVKSIAIMGGGLIGCEFANDWAATGYAVTVIDPGAYPLASLMPEQAGKQLLQPLAQLGVTWRFGTSIQRMDKAAAGYTLSLANGSMMNTDLVISAVGLRPRTQLAKEAGLTINRGIVVDEQLRSNDASIFALGDCAEIQGKVQPFVLPIMHAGRALARVLNGEEAKVQFPAMPVVVKTPAHPVAVAPVARDAVGAWKDLASGQGVKMGFFDEQNDMIGFVLTGEFAGERSEMTKRLV
ncbi:MAG: FAD-dependent oxidoreductase [Sideroxydans sp.]|jgi:rubredoxin-NAD+ reductase